ncbi:hypothetical protein [Persephonella sp.]
MNRKTLEKMLSILSSAQKSDSGYVITEKEYKYLMERIQSELEKKQKKKPETNPLVGQVVAVFMKREKQFRNPINRGKLAREIKETVVPYMEKHNLGLQDIEKAMDFYLKREKGWLYEKKDAHLFIRFMGQVIDDMKKTMRSNPPPEKPRRGEVVVVSSVPIL